MADPVNLIGPVTVANLTAAAGVTTTVDGWWPCLDLTWRTPVPASVTRLVAQVRERGSSGPIAETVVTPGDGLAKIVNGVSMGQHLEVRLAPAGAPGLPFQPTPWLEVTTSWDALMAALDGLTVGCVKIVCGVGAPTRTDLLIGSLSVEEGSGQLWQYEAEAGEVSTSGANIAGTNLHTGANTVTISDIDPLATVTFSKPRAAASGGLLTWDAYSDWATDGDPVAAGLPYLNAVSIYGNNGGSDTLLFSFPTTQFATANAAFNALAAVMPVSFTGYSEYKVAGENDSLPSDNRFGLSVLVEVRPPGWVLKSDLTAIQSAGVEVEGNPRSLNFTGAVTVTTDAARNVTVDVTAGALEVKNEGSSVEASTESLNFVGAALDATTDGSGHVTVTLATDADATLAANSNNKIATQAAVKSYVDNLLAGLSWKKAVRVATTANGTLSSAFENGDTVDGVTLATGDRILIKNQSSGAENGIYTVNASGAPTRATDADSGAELVNAACYVSEGTTNADTQWVCSTNATITVGSTSLTFAQFSSVSAANPTATASDVAVNGSAATFMRSDAAPAIQKASTSLFGVVKPDGATIVATAGVLSVVGSASGTRPPITLLQRTTAQSFSNATWTYVSWDTTAIRDEVSAFSGSTPTYVTVPAGYTLVRVTLFPTWANNATGSRFYTVEKNSTGSPLSGTQITGALFQALNEAPMMLTSVWVVVSPGDKLYNAYFQNSGGSLNFSPTTSNIWSPAKVQFEWSN